MAVGEQVPSFAGATETQFLELREHQWGEVVVEHGRLHVLRT